MSELFQSYEEEFRATAGEAQKKISDVLMYETNPAKKRDAIRQADSQVRQLEDLLKTMKVELRSQDPSSKGSLAAKVQSYDKSLASLKADLQRAQQAEDRDSLLGDKGGMSMEHRQRMLTANDRLNEQNRTIENARKVMAETEQVGLQIGEELESNRGKIQSIRDKVMEVSGLTNTARRLISSISRRETQQRLMLWGVAAILFICIIIIIYYSSKR